MAILKTTLDLMNTALREAQLVGDMSLKSNHNELVHCWTGVRYNISLQAVLLLLPAAYVVTTWWLNTTIVHRYDTTGSL